MIRPLPSLRKSYITLILFVCSLGVRGQFIEGGLMLGGANYLGDLSGMFMNFQLTGASGGILCRYNITEKWTAKGFAGYGRIAGIDSLSSNAFHKKRNLSFFSDIFEASVQIEYNLIRYSYKYYDKKPYVPYVFLGIGVFNFNPKAYFNGKEYELQPLGTEGQGTTLYNDREKYALTTFTIPFGIGVKKRFGERWTLGLELGARYTMTNYLDDVGDIYANYRVIDAAHGQVASSLSDRSAEKNIIGGAPVPQFNEGDLRSNKRFKFNDFYFLGGITVTYRFRKATQCPAFK